MYRLMKKNADETFDRFRELFSSGGTDKIYAKIFYAAANNIAEETTKKEKKEETKQIDMDVYPEVDEAYFEKLINWGKSFYDREDDDLPSLYPHEFDEGLYGALVGGKIRFLHGSYISSMVYPFVKDLDEVKNFSLDENNIWYRRFKRKLELSAKYLSGKVGVSDIICISGANFLFELVGATEAYYAMLEEPEKAARAIEFSLDLNIWLRETFFDTVGLQNGGTFIFGTWFPGRIVNESVDPFHMTSPEMVEKGGCEPLERMFCRFDGGTIHLHGNGRHLLERAAKIDGLKLITLGDDAGLPPYYTILDDIAVQRGSVPVQLGIPCDVFAERLARNTLPGNTLYNVWDVPDLNTGCELIDKIKKYRVRY
jgi:hypothetical protein